MSELQLTRTRFANGVWEGIITGRPSSGARPEIVVTHRDREVEGVELTEGGPAGGWFLRVPVPREAIGEGVQTFLILERGSDARLGDFTLIAGDVAAEDMRAEMELLRAELDMLKRAFRRHCLETMPAPPAP